MHAAFIALGLLLATDAFAADTFDTSDTGADTQDTAEAADTADTSSEWISGSSVSQLAGDEGGFSCSVGPVGVPLLMALPLLALARRRS